MNVACTCISWYLLQFIVALDGSRGGTTVPATCRLKAHLGSLYRLKKKMFIEIMTNKFDILRHSLYWAQVPSLARHPPVLAAAL